MTRKTTNEHAPDPMLPKTPVEINGKVYNLCFDYKAIRDAENAYHAEGHTANLLMSFSDFSFNGVSMVLPCILRTFHPEIGWDEAQAMINLGNVILIGNAIKSAWIEAMPKKAEKETKDPNPLQP